MAVPYSERTVYEEVAVRVAIVKERAMTVGDLESKLLEWSGQQALWKRDMLRRLAVGEAFAAGDYRVYADAAQRSELTKSAHWYEKPAAGAEPEFVPLDVTHLNTTSTGEEPVRVARIVHLEGANDLASGAHLEFNLQGLTIIAGKNGSGKSGYTRILKQVAATRASEPVMPNAFGPVAVPTAVVTYQIGSLSPAQELTWKNGGERVESAMQRVRVFDSGSASAHLAGSTEIAYVPATLQILSEYTTSLQKVGEVIDGDIQRLNLQTRSWPALESGFAVDIFVRSGEKIALDILRNAEPLTADEQAESEAIPGKLAALASSNPAFLAIQARERGAQLKLLARKLEVIADKLGLDNVVLSRKLRSKVLQAKLESDAASVVLDDANTLPGTGNDAWQAMWAAAKEFADDSSDENNFPQAFAVCPLCAQSLEPNSQSRLELFAHFMSGEAHTLLTTARASRISDVDALKALPFDSIITRELIDLVGTYDKAISVRLRPAIDDAVRLRDSLVAADGEEFDAVDPEPLYKDLLEISSALRVSAAAEEVIADALAATDTSAMAAEGLSARRDALALRAGIVAERNHIGAQHDRAIQKRKLGAAKSSCSTTGVSRKNSELSQNYVEKVCHQFEEEAKLLGLERVPVELVFDRSTRGVSYIKVSLKNATQVAVSSVLSEGEQRVTALAGFFADLTESGDTSTLVFDDPVSSLDQEYRVKVARRLLREAESRQVLVFTHDFTFVQYLYEEKRNFDRVRAASGMPHLGDLNYMHISRAQSGTGVSTEAEVWRHVSVKERLGRLKSRQQSAAALYRTGDMNGYEKEARDIIGSVRETWEVFVEQELLHGVVTRHERSVQTQKLAKLVDLTAQDVAIVDLGMSIESRYMTGHAAPFSDASAPQDPTWVLNEIEALGNYRSSVLSRRR